MPSEQRNPAPVPERRYLALFDAAGAAIARHLVVLKASLFVAISACEHAFYSDLAGREQSLVQWPEAPFGVLRQRWHLEWRADLSEIFRLGWGAVSLGGRLSKRPAGATR